MLRGPCVLQDNHWCEIVSSHFTDKKPKCVGGGPPPRVVLGFQTDVRMEQNRVQMWLALDSAFFIMFYCLRLFHHCTCLWHKHKENKEKPFAFKVKWYDG